MPVISKLKQMFNPRRPKVIYARFSGREFSCMGIWPGQKTRNVLGIKETEPDYFLSMRPTSEEFARISEEAKKCLGAPIKPHYEDWMQRADLIDHVIVRSFKPLFGKYEHCIVADLYNKNEPPPSHSKPKLIIPALAYGQSSISTYNEERRGTPQTGELIGWKPPSYNGNAMVVEPILKEKNN